MASEFTKIKDDGLPSTVSEFFTPVEYAKISDLEKKRLINLRLNYEALRSAGFPVSPPYFMCRKVEQKKKGKQKIQMIDQSPKKKQVTDVNVTRVLRESPSRLQQKIRAEKMNEKKAKRLPPHTNKLQMFSEDKCVTFSHNSPQKTDMTGRNVHQGMDNEIYPCSQCNLSFSSFEYLQQHVKTKHHHKYLEFLQHNGCVNTSYRHHQKKASETWHRPGVCKVTHPSLEMSQPPPGGGYGSCSKPTDSLPDNRNGSRANMESNHDYLEVDTQFSSSENCNKSSGKQSGCQDNDKLKSILKTQPNLSTKSVKSPCKRDVRSDFSAEKTQYRCMHTRSHTEQRSYKCDTCFVSFSNLRNLKKHLRRHTEEKSYKCDTCFVSYFDRSTLKSHYRKHTGEKPYKCDTCFVSFSYLCNLKTHYRRHTGEKPYKCETCFVSFSQSSHLKKHYRKHTGEKPYKCDTCFVSFSCPSTLKTHYRRHTREKPYKCDACFVSFSQLSNLKRHNRRHTGEKAILQV